jgi:ubiquinone/menaquinone biosynthesis C-methylase UbiE
MKADLKSYNQQKYQSRQPLKVFLIRRFLSKAFSEVKKTKPGPILDIGCGEGYADKFFLEREPSLDIIGVDKSSQALRVARKNCSQMKTKQGDILRLPFPKNSFNLVLCLEVLEHLESPEKALKEMKRVGRGSWIISVPDEPLFSLVSFFSGKYLKNFGRHPEHIQFWSEKSFRSLLKNYFRRVEVKKCFPWLVGITKLES